MSNYGIGIVAALPVDEPGRTVGATGPFAPSPMWSDEEEIQLSVFAAAFEETPHALLVLDGGRKRVLGANARAREMIGGRREVTELFAEPDLEPLRRAGSGEVVEVSLVGPSHNLRHAILSRLPENDAWLVTLRGDRLRPGDQARSRRLELMGQMAQGVARDFRNVLQAIELAREDLMVRVDAGSENGGGLVLRGVRDALSLGGDLLAILHALAWDGRTPRGRRTDVGAALRRCETLITTVTRNVGTVHVEVPEGSIWVAGDEGRLVQLILQLAMRARDGMGRQGGGAVAITGALNQAGDFHLAVRDDLLPDKGTQAGTEGEGPLHHLVASLGGRLTVTSPLTAGRGTAFDVVLPTVRGEDAAAAESRGRGEVWLVGDDPALKPLVSGVMDLLHLRLHSVEGTRLGRRAAPPGLALCLVDVDAVGRRGHAVEELGAALGLHERAAIPLVLVGGALDGDLRAQVALLASRGATVLRKPVTTAALLRAVVALLPDVSLDGDAPVRRTHEVS